jgi:type IV pilus assembly protein PilF
MSRAVPRAMGLRLVLAGLLAGLAAGCATRTEVTTIGGNESRQSDTVADPLRGAQLRLELAALYLERGQPRTALDELRSALAVRPDLPGAHNLRGLAYASLGEIKLSEESFQRALELNPRDGDAMQNFGWMLCQQRRFDEADALFQRALVQPQYREGIRTLRAQGVCLARAGRWAEAERALSRSYELDPTNPTTAYNLSEVLLRRGELERARFYIARVNAIAEQSNAQSLWLAARIERRLGNVGGVQDFGRRLVERFPQSPEALNYERGRFDD